ncbi:MarR family winged helix-turn-helix transcriptional regulator [Pseudonocardia humida]|uniref:MarR family transcriptional regulator n=1 Tax=Pseudonocardia humida TaxID=2800819 RepID=A0ABT1ABD2_9PSEU|nr:MarR family transcriptional regulator [Pseudonocardia humida]MCO1660355.1 MarR family transcriptional regulator [Pseudonocardia humida]
MSHEDVLPALEEELAALWRHGRVSARDAARQVHPRLDPTAYPMVAVLGQAGPMRISELGAALFLDKSTISRQIDAAVRLGLVERTVDPTDARARLVGLTESGRERHHAARERRRGEWQRALQSWERADIVALTALLAKLNDAGVG